MKSKKGMLNDEIIAMPQNIKVLASQALTGYSPEVNAIIDSGCKDKHRIEKILDGMLDFCWDKKMLELYRKLCRYFYDIDARSTAGYVHAYRDMWDEPEDCADIGCKRRNTAGSIKLLRRHKQ